MAKNDPGFGLWCKSCRTHRPWKDLNTSYELRGVMLVRLWWCQFCDNLVAEDTLIGDGQIDRYTPPTG